MTELHSWTQPGTTGARHCVRWTGAEPRLVVVLSHGYGEHIGRYADLAADLTASGAIVYGLDHMGHGKSEGEPAVISGFNDAVADLHQVAAQAAAENVDLPVVLLGHSMGGLIATRYAQTHGETLAALVLSGPQLAGKDMLEMLLGMPDFPDMPMDPSVLSRDPAVGEAYLADPLVWQGGLPRSTVASMVSALGELENGPRLETLPVLWMHGTEDQLSAIDGARTAVEALTGENLQQRAYPGARHEIFNETNRDEVVADLITFLASVNR